MQKVIKGKRHGFTLIELMIVVAIVGVLAVLAIYGVRKYIANSKTAEARNSLGQIAKDAASALERESSTQQVVAAGSTSNLLRALCASSSKVPGTVPSGQKYQSQKSDWDNDTGWKCLKFTMDQPQYYAYQYNATNTTVASGAFYATAEGDLNGDGTTSSFRVDGQMQSGLLAISPAIVENNPEE